MKDMLTALLEAEAHQSTSAATGLMSSSWPRVRNHRFDADRYSLGVIISALWQTPSLGFAASSSESGRTSEAENHYMVFPFCSGSTRPLELSLHTQAVLQLGDWIRFDNRDLQDGKVREFQRHDEWFVTMPFLHGLVAMECDILVLHGCIRTKVYKPRKEPRNELPNIPFIQGIVDDQGFLTKEHARKKLCATIVYAKGQWRIRHLKPEGHFQYY